MRTGLTMKEKSTAICFNEYGSMIEVQTHNTDLKKRLTAFAKEHPQCCRQIDDDEQGGLTFESSRIGVLCAAAEVLRSCGSKT